MVSNQDWSARSARQADCKVNLARQILDWSEMSVGQADESNQQDGREEPLQQAADDQTTNLRLLGDRMCKPGQMHKVLIDYNAIEKAVNGTTERGYLALSEGQDVFVGSRPENGHVNNQRQQYVYSGGSATFNVTFYRYLTIYLLPLPLTLPLPLRLPASLKVAFTPRMLESEHQPKPLLWNM